MGPVLCSILGPVLGPIFGSLFGPRLLILFDFFVHAPLSSQVAWLGQHSTNAAKIIFSSTLNTCIGHHLNMAMLSTTVQQNLLNSFEAGLTRKLCTIRIMFLSSATSLQRHHLPYRGLRNLLLDRPRKQYADSFLHPFWHPFRARFWVPIWGPRIKLCN